MLSSPLFENNMFNTLAFFKKMQNVDMTQEIAEELALTFLNIHNNQFENLVTKSEFKIETAEIKNEISEIKNEIAEIKNEMRNFVTKDEFLDFKNEIKTEMKKFVTKDEFLHFQNEMKTEMKNLSLNITTKLGIIMTTGIGALAMLIKF